MQRILLIELSSCTLTSEKIFLLDASCIQRIAYAIAKKKVPRRLKRPIDLLQLPRIETRGYYAVLRIALTIIPDVIFA